MPLPGLESLGGSTGAVSNGSEIVIGLSVALSGSGVAPLGIDIQRGAELALEERPSIQIGEQTFDVRLLVLDDLCSADGGQAAANRLVSDQRVVAGNLPLWCGGYRAAGPLFHPDGNTTVTPSGGTHFRCSGIHDYQPKLHQCKSDPERLSRLQPRCGERQCTGRGRGPLSL